MITTQEMADLDIKQLTPMKVHNAENEAEYLNHLYGFGKTGAVVDYLKWFGWDNFTIIKILGFVQRK